MKMRYTALAMAAAMFAAHGAWAAEPEAKKWIDSEFQPSTLSKDQQTAEMKWFIDAAKKLQAKGVKEISVVSETITTHEYESKTLAKAFEEITGIKVKHDLIQEGDVVEKLQTSMQSGKSIYDGWISDSDLIGTHYRYGKMMNLTDYMAGAGKEFTNPGLDLKDFIGTKFTTARRLAETVVDALLPVLGQRPIKSLTSEVPLVSEDRGELSLAARVRTAVRDEMALSLEDVVIRRLGLGLTACPPMDVLGQIADTAGEELGWSERQADDEIRQLLGRFFPSGITRAA